MSLVIRISDEGKIHYAGSIVPQSKDGQSCEGRIVQLLMLRESRVLALCAAKALGEKFQRSRKQCEEMSKAFEGMASAGFKGDAVSAVYLDSSATIHDMVISLKSSSRLLDCMFLIEAFLQSLHLLSDSELEELTSKIVEEQRPLANKSFVYKVTEVAYKGTKFPS